MTTRHDVETAMWKGRPIGSLSREELYEVIAWYADQLAQYQTPEALRAMALGRIESTKRYGVLR